MKGAVTIFEIAVLAILATVLVVVYNVFAQSTTENIVLRTADAIQNQECSMTLLAVYNKDYKRAVDFDAEGDYAEMQEFYGIPTHYDPQNYVSEVTGFDAREGVGGSSKCTTFILDPASLYEGKDGYSVVSGE
jgi:hypothetical protein